MFSTGKHVLKLAVLNGELHLLSCEHHLINLMWVNTKICEFRFDVGHY